MSNLITDWQAALVTYLTAQFATADVTAGERSGVSRDKPRLCVFAPSEAVRPFSGDSAMANVTMVVRYWPKRSKQPATDSPVDPTSLQQAAWDLAEKLEPVRSKTLATSSRLTFEVASIDIDSDPTEWGVEATLTGWTSNPAGAGA